MTTKSTTYTLPHADRAPVARLAKQLTRPLPPADAEAARLRAEVQRLRTELAQTKASLLATEQAALDKAHREERLRPYLLREVDGLAAFRAKLGTRGAHRVHVVITGQTLAITDRHA